MHQRILDPMMFADDTNLFLFHQNIDALVKIFNEKLIKIGNWFKANKLSLNNTKTKRVHLVFVLFKDNWFKANKLSLNNTKTKCTLFHKKSSKDDLPLKLPALKTADNNTERKTEIQFVGVMLDANISWEEQIRTAETKLAKNIGVL